MNWGRRKLTLDVDLGFWRSLLTDVQMTPNETIAHWHNQSTSQPISASAEKNSLQNTGVDKGARLQV